MPKRTDIKSVLVIGAGPIVIGQACEFDYSGTQACKALREEGFRVILVNSNPATIMTDPEVADATYIEPLDPELIEQIIVAEQPDALLPTMGGQTALNLAVALADAGTLTRYNVELIGASREAIATAEDRALFRAAMTRIGLANPRAGVATSMHDARQALREVGLPAIIRPAYTLGGTGGGIARDRDEFEHIVQTGLDASPVGQVQIDESLLGWKEFEMEVVRDRADNAIIICSIENVDPMGVHTGDSITVAPALTLTDREFQAMRNDSIAILREIGVETGGSNVQFAVDPQTGRRVVIEMNPRVSRSSALASKVTGFPIAKVAAKLAIGYTLDELDNAITRVTPASFEPTIDYVVTKIPRFAFEKFPTTRAELDTAMKSVGEAMAIGRNFAESLQKAYASLETGLTGLDNIELSGKNAAARQAEVRSRLAQRNPDRLRVAAQAIREGISVAEINSLTGYDPWFLARIEEIVAAEQTVRRQGLPTDAAELRALKSAGFTDARLAHLAQMAEGDVRRTRHAAGVVPVFKRIDTCAAEFEAETPYLYATYEPTADGISECEAQPSARRKVIVLGGGPNRIGQGIEFDYCCCHACYALAEVDVESIMINCNPETVSTDPDTSDRLYFEPLSAEAAMEIIRVEQTRGTLLGVIAQFGGQTPLRLAAALAAHGIPILGTSPDTIDLAEDRERFQQRLQKLNLTQPRSGTATTEAAAIEVARDIGYPVVIRPSYVLGGRAMRVVRNEAELVSYVRNAIQASGPNPLLIDTFLEGAIELDVDALADGTDAWVAGIMEHIEEAGVHSGDSACALPPHSIAADMLHTVRQQTVQLARELGVVGLMNVQYAIVNDQLFVLEVNPRASRTAPFVAKAVGLSVARIATRLALGESLASFNLRDVNLQHTAVKEAVFPFARFPGVDPRLGPEMLSTGEVMGIDRNFASAFLKSQRGAGNHLPEAGTVFISVRDNDKDAIISPARTVQELGFRLLATKGTAVHLQAAGLEVESVNKVHEGSPHILDRMRADDVALMFNTTEGSRAVADSITLREAVLRLKIPYFTTVPGACAAVEAINQARQGQLQVASLQSFFATEAREPQVGLSPHSVLGEKEN